MTVTVETGAGVRLANSYVSVAEVTAYLTARNRETAWLALASAVQEASVVAATDYVEKRFGRRFKGIRTYSFDEVAAEGLVTFAGLPLDTETLTVGDVVYTFVASLTSPAVAYEVLIGADAAATAQNLTDAVQATAAQAGITHGEGTEENRHVEATASGGIVTLEATAGGAGGNSTVLSGTPTNVTLTAFSGGLDGGSQPLSFPRTGLYDRTGRLVLGIPRKLKEATSEYADRATLAELAPDPDVDDTGAAIRRKREKVGPIEEETEYEPGSHLVRVMRPYPAADLLLAEYLTTTGVSRA